MGNKIERTQLWVQYPQLWQQSLTTHKILINSQTKIKAQYMRKSSKNISEQTIKSYIIRTKNNRYLVNIYGIISANPTISCYTNPSTNLTQSKQDYTILLQNMLYRLPDLGLLQFKDALYILKQCLEGIRVLCCEYENRIFQNVCLQEQMIGINQDGLCKIWLNQDYFQDIVFNQTTIENPEQQSTMPTTPNIVEQLFTLIQKRTSNQRSQNQQKDCQKLKNKIFYGGSTKTNMNKMLYIDNVIQYILKIGKKYFTDIDEYRIDVPDSNNEIGVDLMHHQQVDRCANRESYGDIIKLKALVGSKPSMDVQTNAYYTPNRHKQQNISSIFKNHVSLSTAKPLRIKTKISLKNSKNNQSTYAPMHTYMSSQIKQIKQTNQQIMDSNSITISFNNKYNQLSTRTTNKNYINCETCPKQNPNKFSNNSNNKYEAAKITHPLWHKLPNFNRNKSIINTDRCHTHEDTANKSSTSTFQTLSTSQFGKNYNLSKTVRYI